MNWLWGQKQVYCLRTQPVGKKLMSMLTINILMHAITFPIVKGLLISIGVKKNIVESVNLSPISLNISDSQSKKSFPNISDTFCY